MQVLGNMRVKGVAASKQATPAPVRPAVNGVFRSFGPVVDATAPAPAQPRCAAISQRARSSRSVHVKAVASQAQATAAGENFKRGAHWQVHKFGGTCMAAAERIRAAVELIVKEPGDAKVVVVSAMGSHPSSPLKVTGEQKPAQPRMLRADMMNLR